MALARTASAVLIGVNSHLIDVHVSQAPGLPHLTIVGLPDASMNESPDRVRSAIVNSGFSWPQSKITVGLSPAGLPKRGPGLDVAIALGILASDGQIPLESISNIVAVGELSLDGRIHSVPGALAAGIEVANRAARTLTGTSADPELVCSPVDSQFVALVPGLKVTTQSNLRALVAHIVGEPIDDLSQLEDVGSVMLNPDRPVGTLSQTSAAVDLDLADIGGQDLAKLALEVAAVGGHHLALMGRAGVGKTLLAERLPGLLPNLDVGQSLEVTSIHQLAGENVCQLIRRPPWCAPHHTASAVALVGGGSQSKPQVGLVSLAHRGILFLDEARDGKCTSLNKEEAHEHIKTPAWRQCSSRPYKSIDGLSGLRSDRSRIPNSGDEADLSVSAVVEVPQGQGRRDRAAKDRLDAHAHGRGRLDDHGRVHRQRLCKLRSDQDAKRMASAQR